MGRKPNPTIASFFRRGPKLNNHSNRYPHTCRLCGEDFPKGRIECLTSHITKPGKCPAISETDRIDACLALHGIATAHSARLAKLSTQRAVNNADGVGVAQVPQSWSALEALAEASRQVDMSEKGGKRGPGPSAVGFAHLDTSVVPYPPERLDEQGQFIPEGHANGEHILTNAAELGPEELAVHHLASPLDPSTTDHTSLSAAAAAATARLSPTIVDPNLVAAEMVPASTSEATTAIALPATPPWGEISYQANPPLVFPEATQPPAPLQKGGVRMVTEEVSANGRPRNRRAKFTPARRMEVQLVRKKGACIRCRLLRKNCGSEEPCLTCRRVLAPRVWTTGCVRTRLHEQLELYSAGVQVVLAQNRYSYVQSTIPLQSDGTTIEASHFPETDIKISLLILSASSTPPQSSGRATFGPASTAPGSAVAGVLHSTPDSLRQGETAVGGGDSRAVMIDSEREDVPEKVDVYMRAMLPVFAEREPSHFMRVTLRAAVQHQLHAKDDLLGRAMELWGLVEIIDRERQWRITEIRQDDPSPEPRFIKETDEQVDLDVYTIMCLQLNAAAERRANTTSRQLLNGMQRVLQDSKTKVGFGMFLTALIFLNCVEKSIWAFKAWEEEGLRPGWPLEREPGAFTDQGTNIANLLKMLLSIRKVLPLTEKNVRGKLASAASESDPRIIGFFHELDLPYDLVQSRLETSDFSPTESRSLELAFCSHLLLGGSPSP